MKNSLILMPLVLLFTILSCSKSESDDGQGCTKESLTKTMVGTWKLTPGNQIVTFSSDKTYTDSSKVLHSCSSGMWSATSNDTVLELICGGTSFKEIRIASFSCDTVIVKLSGVGDIPLIRQ